MLNANSDGMTPIEAILRDGTCHYLAPQVLDIMLDHDRILKFKRASGWVTVGIDPMRVRQPTRTRHTSDVCIVEYGPERRRSKLYCHPSS